MSSADRQMTVLIAEDQDDLAEAIELTVAELGHVPLRVRDGVRALQAIERWRPDLLLLDISMPRMDGFGVLRRLAERRDRPPVVVMSAFQDLLREAVPLGADAILRKPFDPRELAQAFELARGAGAGARAGDRARQPPGAPLPGLQELLGAPGEVEMLRVQRLHCLRVLSAERDEALEEIVRAAAELLRTPMALVSIITEDRQWWKAMVGVPPDLAAARGTGREHSFCTHAVAAQAPLVVADARDHPVFRGNALVRRGVVTAYAGVPVTIPAVGALGTLCVLDTAPRVFSAVDIELLSVLAARVAAEVEWRERRADDPRPLGTFEHMALVDERHELYNPPTFASILGVVARLALQEGSTFGLVGFSPSGPGALEALDPLARALKETARASEPAGWVDTRSVGAILPRCDEARAGSFAASVLAAHRRLAPADAAAPTTVVLVERGALLPSTPLHRLRFRLHPGAPFPGADVV